MEETLKELAREEKAKTDSINRLQLEIEDLVAVRKKADSEAIEASLALEEVKERLEDEKKKIQPIRIEQEKASKELNDTQKEVFRVLQELKERKIELKNVETQIERERKEELVRKEKANDEFQNEYDEKSKKIVELSDRATELSTIIVSEEQKLKEKQTLIVPLDAQIASLRNEVKRLDNLLEKNQNALDEAISAQKLVAETIREAQARLDTVNQEVLVATKAKIDAENELTAVKEELSGQVAVRIQIGQQREDLDVREKYLKELYKKAGVAW